MPPDAEIRVPAERAFVSVVRVATAGIAARLDFTLDAVEDLRMSVGEACNMLLDQARPGGRLVARFRLEDGRIDVEVSVDALHPSPPETGNFAWQVLASTAEDVRAETGTDLIRIGFAVRSGASEATT